MRNCILVLLTVGMTTWPALGQDGSSGAIRGTILDPANRRVARATIVLVNNGTGFRYEHMSDSAGRFAFQLFPPGEYSARVTSDGMSPQVNPVIHVSIGGVAEIDFKLTIAGASESVVVSAEPKPVETGPRGLSTVIDERAILNLPLNGRRFTDLCLLTPEAKQDPRGQNSTSNGDLSFGGIRGFQTSYLVDGGDNNNALFAQARGRYRAPYQFSNEVIQEFRVSSNAISADSGRAGGAVVNVVTKSGSNAVHVSAFYHLRNSEFNARDPELDFKPTSQQHQFGFTRRRAASEEQGLFLCRI
jgi:hypothetical protein